MAGHQDHDLAVPTFTEDNRFNIILPAPVENNRIFTDFMTRERNSHGFEAITSRDWQIAAAREMEETVLLYQRLDQEKASAICWHW